MLGRNHLNVCDLQLHPITIKHFLTHLWKIKPEEMQILIINKEAYNDKLLKKLINCSQIYKVATKDISWAHIILE